MADVDVTTAAWGSLDGEMRGKETTDTGLREYGSLYPWAGARRIPLPDQSTIECTLDRGRAVAQVWFADGHISALCLDHDRPDLPLPVQKPFWWRYPWPYGPPPSYCRRLARWLRAFPRP